MFNFYTNFETLTADEYQNNLVNFYNQTLGATGIRTTPPEKEKDKEEEYVAPTIIPDSEGDSNLDFAVRQVKGESVLDFNDTTYDVLNMDLPSSYNEHLESLNRADQSDISKFEKSFNSSMQNVNDKVNKNLDKTFGVSVGFPSAKQAQKYAGVKGLATFLGVNPLISTIAGSAVAGTTEKNILGKEGQFKPSGIFGIVHDVSESMKLNAYNANQQAYRKAMDNYDMGNLGVDGDVTSYLQGVDVGFSATIGGQDIYRKEGDKIYNGAMYGMSQEQALRLEALAKGKSMYNFDPTNPDSSESLVVTDKEGGYDERGNFHDGRFGVSAVGRERNAENAAIKAGVTYNEFMKALSIARTTTTPLSKAIQDIKDEKFRTTETKKTTTTTRKVEPISYEDDTVATPPPPDTSVDDVGSEEDPDPVTDYEGGVGDFDYNPSDDGGDDNASTDTGSVSEGGYGGVGATAMGGRIGMREGGNTTEVVQPAGFIAPDPNATDQQEIADDKPMDAKKGDFIINAPAAEEAGKQDIQRMIDTAITNLQEKGVDVRFGNPKMNIRDRVKLLVSRNEVYIPAIIAKEIGYDRLKKINNRGKREVQRRQEQQQPQQGVNLGGFIQKKKGDVVEEKTLDSLKIKKGDYVRKEVDAIIKKLPTADALALLMQGEAKNLGDEGLEGAAHVLVNRTNAKGYKNFGRSLLKELTSKYKGKKGNLIFEFNAFEPSKFKESLETFKRDKQKYLKVRNIAEDVLAGSRFDFTGGALFFNNPNVKGDEYFTTQVATGNFQETTRTVNKNQPKTLHVYYIPKDFKRGTEVKPKPQMRESFIGLDPDLTTRPKVRIPESKGGSFLFRGSDYERGGATPAL